MTPDEKFNQNVWWILQEIRNDELLTAKGEKVDFRIRELPRTSGRNKTTEIGNIPSGDTQRKLFQKLKEWEALDLEVKSDLLLDNDFFNPPTRFTLRIYQPKFDEVYKKYQDACDITSYANAYQEKLFENLNENKNQKLPEFSQVKIPEQSVIRSKTLELIAQDIGNLNT